VGADRIMDTVVGVVVIGRNEGERLRRCLESLRGVIHRMVYVDSGSTDESVELSRSLGIGVHQAVQPFTAARARNAGFDALTAVYPELAYVFFVDGDCEVLPGWLETAVRFLDQHPRVALVWGRRRERYPEKTIYNMLCDIEWSSVPPGETQACGGDAVLRVVAFRDVHGYRADLICGEEPELCVRLRHNGWQIWRLDKEMTLHDAALEHFSQWWKRSIRCGYAYAQGASLHGSPPDRLWVRESRKAWLWGLWIPLAALALAVTTTPWALLVLLLYPLQIVRLALRLRHTVRANWTYAWALVLSKFAEMLGQIKFLRDRYGHKQSTLIEYK
jgi:glycosyltransferase involved in cell wall biosynthesis